jgi:hypothetical protein
MRGIRDIDAKTDGATGWVHALGRVRLAGDRVEHFAVAELAAAVAQRGAQVLVGFFLRRSNRRIASVSIARARRSVTPRSPPLLPTYGYSGDFSTSPS